MVFSFTSDPEKKSKGVSEFERHLKNLGIRYILARVTHSQTNGKLERGHGEMQCELLLFRDVVGSPASTTSATSATSATALL